MKRFNQATKPSFEANLADKVYLFLDKHQLWNFKKRIIVAVSGGRDSTALLHILHHLVSDPSSLLVAHFDHNVRPDSIEDARSVEEMAGNLGIKYRYQCQDYPVPRGVSKEAFWRKVRYEFLTRIMTEENASGIATGHTADDQLETLIYRLITGCGPRGLLGIRHRSQNGIFRPLLTTTRHEIDSYITEQNLPVREDPSNSDKSIPRNYIRHAVVPLLKHLNPQVHTAIQSLVDLQGDEDSYMASHSREVFDTVSKVENNCVRLKTDLLINMHPALIRRIGFHVLQFLNENGTLRMDRTKMDALTDLCLGRKKSLSLHPGIKGCWREDYIWIYLSGSASPDLMTAQNLECPGTIQLGSYSIRASIVDRPHEFPDPSETIFLDLSTLPLMVRTAVSSDFFHPIGMPEQIKLNHFYRNRRIPSGLRSVIPLVLDRNHDIAAVIGHGVGVNGALDEKSDRAVKLTWKQH
jgi:tRNA(Ile)-lysidine synthase